MEEGAGAEAGFVLVAAVRGAEAGVGFVVVGAVGGAGAGVAPGEVFGPGLARTFFLRCGRFGVAFALPTLVDCAVRLLVVSPLTLVSKAIAPDEYESEACFDRMCVREMDGCAAETDPIGTSSGLEADPAGAPSGGAWLGERMSGAATAQITKASAAVVITHKRTTNSGRSPQTGLINLILTFWKSQSYPSFGGGRPL